MSILCAVCDRSIIENESEYKNYITTLRRKNDKSLYKKHTNSNVNLDEFDKILTDYNTTLKENFDFHLFNCEFKIEFDNNFTTNTENDYFYNVNANNMKSYFTILY